MPSYVITRSSGQIGETVEGVLCDSAITGLPDRRTDVPVRIQRVSEQALQVDGEPRRIIWGEGGNGIATFLVDGSTRGLRNRERRVALARASGLLRELASCLGPLTAESEEAGCATEGLGLLFNWLARETERAERSPHDPAR